MLEVKSPTAALHKWLNITIIALLLLILAGGIVRSTGSGMGCPDWPKCFDRWVPPTEVSQLPPDYQERYSHRGYADTSFNVWKTWTEYVNRLIGAIVGFLFIICALLSVRLYRYQRSLTIWAIIALLLIMIQGWLGAKVVESNLQAVKVTLHMILALVILAVMVLLKAKLVNNKSTEANLTLKIALGVSVGLTIVQIILGTRVREGVDEMLILLGQDARGQWLEQIGNSFYIHRNLAIVVVLVNAWLVVQMLKVKDSKVFSKAIYAIIGVTVIQLISGAIMSYKAIPPVFQCIHLICATLLFTILFYEFLKLTTTKKTLGVH